jgi:hypothetical protein
MQRQSLVVERGRVIMQRPTAIVLRNRLECLFIRGRRSQPILPKAAGEFASEQRVIVLRNQKKM